MDPVLAVEQPTSSLPLQVCWRGDHWSSLKQSKCALWTRIKPPTMS